MIDSFNADRTGWARFSDDMTMRYRLARSLDGRPLEVHEGAGIVEADRCVTFVMLNPSTADAFIVDPTVRRCIGFARAWGADVLQVVNLFALRATDPGELYGQREIGDDRIADEEIRNACVCARPIVAAWGVHGAYRARGRWVRERLEAAGHELEHLGLTKDRHPRHPLYLKATTQPEVWAP